MTDAEAVAVLRRLHDTDFDALPDELAAIERAIVLLEREATGKFTDLLKLRREEKFG